MVVWWSEVGGVVGWFGGCVWLLGWVVGVLAGRCVGRVGVLVWVGGGLGAWVGVGVVGWGWR